jgi:hypothetical protein
MRYSFKIVHIKVYMHMGLVLIQTILNRSINIPFCCPKKDIFYMAYELV